MTDATGHGTSDDTGHDRRWWVLIAMTGALSMILIDDTVVSVAMPSIQRDLHMSSTSLQWIMNAYLLTIAAFIAVAGRLSDGLGRVRVFLVGVVVFVVCSVLSGLSSPVGSSTMLIAARALQGIGAALMIPSSQAIVTSAFPLRQRGTAMGIYAGVSMAFLAMGPLVGGLLTQHVGWEWVFYVNVPVGIATFALTLISRPADARSPMGRFDWAGAVLIVVGLSGVVVALMQSTTWGWTSPLTLGVLAGGIVALVVFVLVERRASDPLVQLDVLRYGNFATDTAVLFLVQIALMAVSIYGAIYQQDVLGFDPVSAGLALLPITVPMLFVAPASGRLYDRFGPRPLVAAGSALVALGIGLTGWLVSGLSYPELLPGYVLIGIGIALIMTPANTDAMNSAPGALRGQASGVVQTMRQIGGAVGLALMSTIVLNLTNAATTDNLETAGFTAAQASDLEGVLAQAQEGATSVTSVFSSVPASMVDTVVAAFKDGFATGLRAGYAVVAALMVLAAVLAVLRLRRIEFSEDGGVAET